MDERRADRLSGWAGIVFSVLSLVVFPLVLSPPAPPIVGQSGAEVAVWFDLHRTGFLVGNYLGVAAFLPGFVQLTVLAARIRRAEGEGGFIATLVLTTGTFGYAVFACSLIAFQAMPFLLAPHLQSSIEALGSLTTVWFALDGLAAFPLVIAVGIATVTTGVLPRWFARLSWVVAALALAMSIGALTTSPSWLAAGGAVTGVGFIGFFVWTFVLGVTFLRRMPAGAISAARRDPRGPGLDPAIAGRDPDDSG